MEETSRVGREVVVSSGPGDFNKIRCLSFTHLYRLVLSCRLDCAMKLKHLSRNVFGGKGGRAEKCIG